MAIMVALLFGLSSCGKSSDYYYKDFLDQAEIAKPGKVDSLQLLPGANRAILRFIVGPDRRVNRLLISYNTSLSAEVSEIAVDIGEQDYANYKEVLIEGLPESTLITNVSSLSATGDVSNLAETSARIYGPQYVSTLGNRIFDRFTTDGDVRQINFLQESGLPQNPNVFTPMQHTEIVYPINATDSVTLVISPYERVEALPNIVITGSLKFRTSYKPVENALDSFYGPWREIDF